MGQPVVHFEVGCRNSEKTRDFYSKLFDWKIEQMGPAGMIQTGGNTGINGHINSLGHEPHNYVTIYVEVDDLHEYLKKAHALGGKTIIPPSPVPGRGEFAWMSDPDGNVIGLWKPAK